MARTTGPDLPRFREFAQVDRSGPLQVTRVLLRAVCHNLS